MKNRKFSSTAQMLVSSSIFVLSMLLLQFSPLNEFHGRSDAPIIVGAFGVLALLISFAFSLKPLNIMATGGYLLALAIGVIFQSDGVDPGGGLTNNWWKIWFFTYWAFLGIGAVISAYKKIKQRPKSRH